MKESTLLGFPFEVIVQVILTVKEYTLFLTSKCQIEV